ncbi:hypothetical protein F0227_01055 [Vibrio sp. 99-8-1]|nr:hypothetical protein [Vibrio sp. 99-8-1]
MAVGNDHQAKSTQLFIKQLCLYFTEQEIGEKKKSLKRSSSTGRQKRSATIPNGLFFSLHTRRMVGIVHKNLQIYCDLQRAGF